MPKQRLELNWIGKDVRPRLEPRILIEDAEKSYHAPFRVSDTDIYDNMLIHGDNLLALKALEQDFRGKVKCIYIDPPYNTGKAFEYYDDGLEHSIWLSLLYERLNILRNLLRPDGFFCCHIDDSEGAYLKVMLDEVFGRSNYLSTLFVQVRYAEKTLTQDMNFHKQIEQIHVYRKEFGAKPNLKISDTSFEKFCYYVTEKADGREMALGGKKVVVFSKDEYEIIKGEGTEDGRKEIWASGSILDGNSSGRFFRDYLEGRKEQDGLGVLYKVFGIGDDKFDHRYFTGPKSEKATKGKYYQGVPLEKLQENSTQTTPIENFYDLAGSFGNCRNEGGVEFRSGKKPEILLNIILRHFSSPGDLVLDSFLGSGTTAAVAHKMGRRWIGIELGEHCYTHCVPRLQKVINGEDQGGISQAMQWQGGGGFRFYELGPSLIKTDKWGNAIINKEFNGEMLAQALCKLSGYVYMPDSEIYWMQGQGSEADYMYATTQFLSAERLVTLNEEVGDGRSLLVYCTAFRLPEDADALNRLTVRKIPKSILAACEWDRDDYSLNIQNLPQAEVVTTPEKKSKSNGTKKKAKDNGQNSLLEMPDK